MPRKLPKKAAGGARKPSIRNRTGLDYRGFVSYAITKSPARFWSEDDAFKQTVFSGTAIAETRNENLISDTEADAEREVAAFGNDYRPARGLFTNASETTVVSISNIFTQRILDKFAKA